MTEEHRTAERLTDVELTDEQDDRATALERDVILHPASAACEIIYLRDQLKLERGDRYDDKRDLDSVIAHLRFGDSDGQDHDDAADALEKWKSIFEKGAILP